MGWLFSDELAKRGREPSLDAEFTANLTQWKSAMSVPAHLTRGTGAVGASAAPPKAAQKPAAPATAPRRPVGIFAAAAIASALVTLALGVGHFWGSASTLLLNTQPIHAEVLVDGVVQPGSSPLRIKVARDVPHHIEVRAAGFETFVTERTVGDGQEEHLDVRLEHIDEPPPPVAVQEPAKPEPAAPEPNPEPPAGDEPLPSEANYPIVSFKLATAQHVVVVPGHPNAAAVVLKPNVAYTISTDGAYTYGYGWTLGSKLEGTSVNSTTALYFVEGGTSPSFGEVGPKPLTVRGKNLYLFLPDNNPMIRKGALRVNVKAPGTAPQVVLLDPKRNAIRPEAQQQFVLRALDPRIVYRFDVRALPGGASLGAAGKADRIVCARATSGFSLGDAARQPRISQVLEAGKSVEMTRVRELTCMLFDDRLDDNQGGLEVNVVSLGVQPSDPVAMFDQLEKAGRISLYGLEFEPNSDKITPQSEKLLLPMKQQLEHDPQMQLSIEGHTDDRGSPSANETLSLARAESVKRWFVAHGIAAARLTAKGLGDRQPVGDNGLEEGRALNRRVELVRK
jgi:outer membrane protein OmpA-like peptidoglycan-associated protein